MVARVALSALAALTLSSVALRAEPAAGETSGGVPTVTIINKSDASTPGAPPELKVTPQPAQRPTAATTPASTTPPAEQKAKAEPAPAAKPPVAAAEQKPVQSVPEKAATAATAPVEPKADQHAPAAAKPAPLPEPTLAINIDLSRQLMTVSENGGKLYSWPISSARYGYHTPTGTFRPSWMAKMWYSRQYDDAPMPNAIFFHKGVAIHATYATRALGRPASHGCVRLAPKNAATLYKLVSEHGKERTEIVVHGKPVQPDAEVAEDTRRRYAYDDDEGEEIVRYRRAPAYRYMPPSYYGRGYAAPPAYYYPPPRMRRGYYGGPRRPPRGLYNSYSYGYGF